MSATKNGDETMARRPLTPQEIKTIVHLQWFFKDPDNAEEILNRVPKSVPGVGKMAIVTHDHKMVDGHARGFRGLLMRSEDDREQMFLTIHFLWRKLVKDDCRRPWSRLVRELTHLYPEFGDVSIRSVRMLLLRIAEKRQQLDNILEEGVIMKSVTTPDASSSTTITACLSDAETGAPEQGPATIRTKAAPKPKTTASVAAADVVEWHETQLSLWIKGLCELERVQQNLVYLRKKPLEKTTQSGVKTRGTSTRAAQAEMEADGAHLETSRLQKGQMTALSGAPPPIHAPVDPAETQKLTTSALSAATGTHEGEPAAAVTIPLSTSILAGSPNDIVRLPGAKRSIDEVLSEDENTEERVRRIMSSETHAREMLSIVGALRSRIAELEARVAQQCLQPEDPRQLREQEQLESQEKSGVQTQHCQPADQIQPDQPAQRDLQEQEDPLKLSPSESDQVELSESNKHPGGMAEPSDSNTQDNTTPEYVKEHAGVEQETVDEVNQQTKPQQSDKQQQQAEQQEDEMQDLGIATAQLIKEMQERMTRQGQEIAQLTKEVKRLGTFNDFQAHMGMALDSMTTAVEIDRRFIDSEVLTKSQAIRIGQLEERMRRFEDQAVRNSKGHERRYKLFPPHEPLPSGKSGDDVSERNCPLANSRHGTNSSVGATLVGVCLSTRNVGATPADKPVLEPKKTVPKLQVELPVRPRPRTRSRGEPEAIKAPSKTNVRKAK